MENGKVYAMRFAKLNPLLVRKAVNKGRVQDDAEEIIRWLTGYSQQELARLVGSDIKCGAFLRTFPHSIPTAPLSQA